MPFLSKMISFWNNLFRRRQVERDLNDELQAYVEEMSERKIQAGLTPEAAREAALLELGGMERIKDLVRRQRVGFGNPGRVAPIVVVAIVAFACGASTAVGVMRWSAPAAVAPARAEADERGAPVLEGRVVDSATGQPIPDVEVGLRASPPMWRYTFTDDKGHFVFRNPPNQPYGLEAGKQRWTINQAGTGLAAPYPSSDFFEFVTPSVVSVKGKDGQPLEGERVAFIGVGIDGKPYPPPGREFRRFHYSTSVVELRGENISPGGKVAKR